MTMGKIKRDPKAVAIAQMIIDQYKPGSVEDMNDAMKYNFGQLLNCPSEKGQ